MTGGPPARPICAPSGVSRHVSPDGHLVCATVKNCRRFVRAVDPLQQLGGEIAHPFANTRLRWQGHFIDDVHVARRQKLWWLLSFGLSDQQRRYNGGWQRGEYRPMACPFRLSPASTRYHGTALTPPAEVNQIRHIVYLNLAERRLAPLEVKASHSGAEPGERCCPGREELPEPQFLSISAQMPDSGLKDTRHMNSWNSSHGWRGCSQDGLKSTGGAGLIFCFLAN
jgi:hypothetical protein